jgi:hypothetical protein
VSAHRSKTIELRKQRFLNGDVILGVLLCAAIVVRRYVQSDSDTAFYLLLAGVVFAPLVLRKFARSIVVDFSAQTLHSVGIVSLFRQSYSFDDLDYVRCPPAVSLDTAEVFNLIFRRQGAIQPLIFEVRSETERAQARALLVALRSAIPDKIHDDALSEASNA